MPPRSLPTVAAVLTFVFLLAPGCGETVLSGKDWQITDATDNFQFQATGMQNFSKHLEWAWTNTGTLASVNQACSITGGTAALTLLDANGTLVYSHNLKDNGTYPSSAGVAGTWLIRLELNKTDGTLNFRVQKAP